MTHVEDYVGSSVDWPCNLTGWLPESRRRVATTKCSLCSGGIL
jgi:hypothetical protein